ncbi:uncharacterized protein MONBRDRAFT_24583 [Monosiga brevicollis MX1]|uniref:WW domain-containing protein n=1 Tax=Monosiga brevicollis TaxID=81824 RepID=A9UWW0_MONBE|nr:uncharacterized protein MONBRDRAFT_24583 [Monosiga brevicollis MX1]EDQ90111.1 predicted protein [Monosiga brevicollis MX1]|eukprot:XP_001744878.1 hypothetical protein [Monosiga brevicollis MX1]
MALATAAEARTRDDLQRLQQTWKTGLQDAQRETQEARDQARQLQVALEQERQHGIKLQQQLDQAQVSATRQQSRARIELEQQLVDLEQRCRDLTLDRDVWRDKAQSLERELHAQLAQRASRRDAAEANDATRSSTTNTQVGAEAETSHDVLRQRIKHLESSARTLASRVGQLEAEKDNAVRERNHLLDEAHEVNAYLERLKADLAHAQASSSTHRTDGHPTQSSYPHASLLNQFGADADTRAQISMLESSLQKALDQRDRARQDVSSLQHDLTALRHAHERLRGKAADDIQSARQQASSSTRQLERRLTRLQGTGETQAAALDALQGENRRLQSQLQTLSTTNAQQSAKGPTALITNHDAALSVLFMLGKDRHLDALEDAIDAATQLLDQIAAYCQQPRARPNQIYDAVTLLLGQLEALHALPEDWSEHRTELGLRFYADDQARQTSWLHPVHSAEEANHLLGSDPFYPYNLDADAGSPGWSGAPTSIRGPLYSYAPPSTRSRTRPGPARASTRYAFTVRSAEPLYDRARPETTSLQSREPDYAPHTGANPYPTFSRDGGSSLYDRAAPTAITRNGRASTLRKLDAAKRRRNRYLHEQAE